MITVELNSVDIISKIKAGSLNVVQQITHQIDTAQFVILMTPSKGAAPQYGDEIEIYDGTAKIFGGTVAQVDFDKISNTIFELTVQCSDWTYTMDKLMASRTYENETIEDIITDLITSYAPGFTTNNVTSTFLIKKIVFNQVPLSQCIKRLAEVIGYDWYVDEDKDVHFFGKYDNIAPFNFSDDEETEAYGANYIFRSLSCGFDGTQVANRIKVRGGLYDGSTFTDVITVSGNVTKSFKLPYGFANLVIEVDTGSGYVAKTVGIDFIDDFPAVDVLYNYQDQMIRFENDLASGNKIRFSGNPKVPVFAVSEDPVSIAQYGKIEKLIRDDSIESNEVARRRANAELYLCSEPIVDAKAQTYRPGLRAGMTITVKDNQNGFNEQLMIKKVAFKMRTPFEFYYDVDMVSTSRYEFVTLLQMLLEPEPKQSDEREVAEEIYTDTQNITISEQIEMTAAFDFEEEVEAQENYVVDPFGANTNAIYVLSPYTPTSQTDTKRPGRLDISMVVY